MNIKKQDIQKIILRDFSWVPKLNNKLHVVDNEYISISKTFVLNTIKHDEWLKREISYRPDVFDCDDYVMYLKCKLSKLFVNDNQKLPAALGFIITDRHAFNFSIDYEGRIIIYDTVATKLELNPTKFKIFLDYKPGNTVKLMYI
ncbi:MAG: hypothetical protein R2781_03555 [Flavobacteriaceae bacterium]